MKVASRLRIDMTLPALHGPKTNQCLNNKWGAVGKVLLIKKIQNKKRDWNSRRR